MSFILGVIFIIKNKILKPKNNIYFPGIER